MGASAPSRTVARVISCALWGLETALVTVEADVANGLPSFTVVGLPDPAIQEARERVRAAIRNSGYDFPLRRVTVNLAPAERKKEGAGFDLAIALAILRASGQLLADVGPLCLGELALDGSLRPVRGVMPRVQRGLECGTAEVIVAPGNASEAAAIGASAFSLGDLRAVVAHLEGGARVAPARPPAASPPTTWPVDLADIAGQDLAKRALEVAAAGGHNLLLLGPPGTGKTLLARSLPSLLPPYDAEERLEASAIHSVAGLVDAERPLLATRPFRAPHHTASRLALVGGGSPPRPGEVSLAHTGVLFMDELPEFSSFVLETLREPLEEGRVTISRAGSSATYPARFVLVASQNPCPCGFLGDSERSCSCLPDAVARYRAKISGPLLDRIDLRVHVPRVPYRRLRDHGATDGPAAAETSSAVRERIAAARERMRARFAGSATRVNGDMGIAHLRRFCGLGAGAEAMLSRAVAAQRLSARGYHRVLRVARTVADLAGAESIDAVHLGLALLLRAEP